MPESLTACKKNWRGQVGCWLIFSLSTGYSTVFFHDSVFRYTNLHSPKLYNPHFKCHCSHSMLFLSQ